MVIGHIVKVKQFIEFVMENINLVITRIGSQQRSSMVTRSPIELIMAIGKLVISFKCIIKVKRSSMGLSL